jgi:predicted enzyme related to lactoylglutathione lyase
MAASDGANRDNNDEVDSGLARHGHISYLEIPALDGKQSAAFYEAVFDWRVEPRDAGRISFDDLSGNLIGSFVTNRTVSRTSGLVAYIHCDRIDAIVERIAAEGGEIVKPPYPEGNLWIAAFRDPAGNLLGVWQSGPRQ